MFLTVPKEKVEPANLKVKTFLAVLKVKTVPDSSKDKGPSQMLTMLTLFLRVPYVTAVSEISKCNSCPCFKSIDYS